MSLVCPHCTRELNFTGEQPRFCAYCGQRLTDPRYDATVLISGPVPETRFTTPLGAPQDETDPSQIDVYRLLRRLGSGGMGTVYEAEDERTGRRVAVKLIAPKHVRSSQAVERFRQEGRLASTIHHPRCVFVLTADEAGGRPFIVMELMPGETLQSLVERGGPPRLGDALSKILDVIEGLEEAHRLGVVHRDVKPSNCFLEAGGRVKVGDFGLSKSLIEKANLTLTGSFLGTPLYASPEQIKGEAVDERTDVYSVTATLYYLLTGRPPIEEHDAAATVARIVSEPAPSIRSIRRDLPAALEGVIQRGLERDRERRYESLAELRAALEPLLPGGHTIGGIGLRAWAYALDLILGLVLFEALHGALGPILPRELVDDMMGPMSGTVLVVLQLVGVGYFTLLEGGWGATVGKRLCGLRVRRASGEAPVGLGRAFVRTLVFFLMVVFPGDLVAFVVGAEPEGMNGLAWSDWGQWAFSPGALAASGLGVLVVASTMRLRTGFRGPHEWASGTRVVRLRGPARRGYGLRGARRRAVTTRSVVLERPAGVPEELGHYRVRGAIHWDGPRRVLLGEDITLGRAVWIKLQPPGSGQLPNARYELARRARPRWLEGGIENGERWDAFVAPSGCPLAELAGPRGLSWADARPIIEDIVEELAAAQQDGTLPRHLAVDQVWAESNGHGLLIDALAHDDRAAVPDEAQGVALAFLVQVLTVAMEGRDAPLDTAQAARSIRRPMPRHAAAILDRLTGRTTPYRAIGEVMQALHATRALPRTIGRARRLGHLFLQTALCSIGLAMMIGLTWGLSRSGPVSAWGRWEWLGLGTTVSWPLAWIVWSGLTRGGLTLALAGMALVRRDNRPVGALRAAWRAGVVWLPITILLLAPVLLEWFAPSSREWGLVAWWAGVACLPLAVAFAVAWPARGPHDRLAGTYLVPL